ncbi:hypothetical protein [Entomomonas moraniae]|nr:hypothetical protein [Entomomonas moraniae]
MKLIKPKVHNMMSGNLAIINDIRNGANKIIVPCFSIEDGKRIISLTK